MSAFAKHARNHETAGDYELPMPTCCGECEQFSTGPFEHTSPHAEVGMCRGYAHALIKTYGNVADAIVAMSDDYCYFLDYQGYTGEECKL